MTRITLKQIFNILVLILHHALILNMWFSTKSRIKTLFFLFATIKNWDISNLPLYCKLTVTKLMQYNQSDLQSILCSWKFKCSVFAKAFLERCWCNVIVILVDIVCGAVEFICHTKWYFFSNYLSNSSHWGWNLLYSVIKLTPQTTAPKMTLKLNQHCSETVSSKPELIAGLFMQTFATALKRHFTNPQL